MRRRATRRAPLISGALALGLAGCRSGAPGVAPVAPQPRGDEVRKIDVALVAARDFLLAAQSPDGAWRSQVYGVLGDGPSLTPHVLSALCFLPDQDGRARAALARGAEFLTGIIVD